MYIFNKQMTNNQMFK